MKYNRTEKELPGVRYDSCTFNLNLPSPMGARLYFPQVHHSSISQLTCKKPKLMTAVTVRSQFGAREQSGAAQILLTHRITQYILYNQAEKSQR